MPQDWVRQAGCPPLPRRSLCVGWQLGQTVGWEESMSETWKSQFILQPTGETHWGPCTTPPPHYLSPTQDMTAPPG